jgi:DNA-binding SARP family transcriptional activator
MTSYGTVNGTLVPIGDRLSRTRPGGIGVVRRDGGQPGVRPPGAGVVVPINAQRANAPALQIHLLGGFRLVVGGRTTRIAAVAQRLLALLGLQDQELPRSTAARMLWPDANGVRALGNVRSAVYRLNRQCPEAIEVSNSDLRLAPFVTVDVRQVRQLATRLLADATPMTRPELHWAVQCKFYDDLLPEWDDEWLVSERERVRQTRLHCLEKLSLALAADGWYGAAVDAALAAVHADPLRESAHEALIRAHLAEGNRGDALNHYRAYRRSLREELGLEPSGRLDKLLWSA